MTGQRRHGHRWEVFVRVNKVLYRTSFPLSSTPEQRAAWRVAQRHHVPPPVPQGALGRDAARTLQTMTHLPSYADKQHYLRFWVNHFGLRRLRSTITSAEIAAALSALLTRYAPTTVRHYRTALQQVWTVCDGVAAPNPVSATPRPRDRPPVPRAVPLEQVRRVLEQLRPQSLTRARLLVILTTGLPHAQVMSLTPADWDKRRKVLRVSARKKGGGTSWRVLPLSDAAMNALREFAAVGAWGRFSQSSMRQAVHRACDALKIPRFRPYDLRHVHGTLLYHHTGDLATTARLLGHSSTKTAERYTQEAFAAVDRQAVAKVGPELARELAKRKTRSQSA